MDDRETKAPTVEDLLRLLGTVSFQLRNVAFGLLSRLEDAQKKLDAVQPAYPLIAEAKVGAEALLSLDTILQGEFTRMRLPRSS